jgi:3',5'-cyclic AMP phosphodiesterase CpdA
MHTGTIARLAQLSDFHFTQLTWNPFRLFPKRWLGQANWLLHRRSLSSPTPLRALPRYLRDLGVDWIVLGGDFTSTALPREFDQVRSFLAALPAPYLAVPGNHDYYTVRSFRTLRYFRAVPSQRDPASETTCPLQLAQDGVEAKKIAPQWWMVSIDTSRPTRLFSAQGLFSKKLEERLLEALRLIPATDSIAMLSHYPFLNNGSPKHGLRHAARLEEIVRADRRIRLYLHGHTHRQTVANLQPSGLPVVCDGGFCGAGAWNLLSLDAEGVEVQSYRWQEGWQIARTQRIAWTR